MNFLRRLTPFFIMGLVLLALSFGVMLLFYLLLLSFAVSLVLYVVNLVKSYFSRTHPLKPKKVRKSGRIIDSDEWHHL